MNLAKLEPVLIKAEAGDTESCQIVREVLRPLATDTVAEIQEKIRIHIGLMFYASLKFKDAPHHIEIDQTYAEQIHSLLTKGKPKYKGIIIVGYRESAKTARVKFNQSYINLYLPRFTEFVNITSADGNLSAQFTMDMFNMFAFSKITKYHGALIEGYSASTHKESKTRRRFTTTSDVTYSAFSALQSTRGSAQTDIDATGEISMKRPKQCIFDDIENETTVGSIVRTESIRSVIDASVLGMDQITGFWVMLGNYLSLRGNVNHYIKKYEDDPDVKKILIPIKYGSIPSWPAKYCATDAEQRILSLQGVNKVSIESIERDNPLTFQTEWMNNPTRSKVYFDDNVVRHIDIERLVPESQRDKDGLLIIEEPTVHDRYIMSADTSKGIGRDDSAFVVLKVTGATYEEVANFKCNTMKPEVFAPYSVRIAEKYNNAFLIPESNFPGNEFIYIAKQTYKQIYKEGEGDDAVYGVATNMKTKPEMFLKAKTILISRLLTVRSVALHRQIMEYPNEEVNKVVRDGDGGHFDLIMALVVGLYKATTQSAEDNSGIDELLARINRERPQQTTSKL